MENNMKTEILFDQTLKQKIVSISGLYALVSALEENGELWHVRNDAEHVLNDSLLDLYSYTLGQLCSKECFSTLLEGILPCTEIGVRMQSRSNNVAAIA